MTLLDQALDAVVPDLEGYVAERAEANLVVGVTSRGQRAWRTIRTPGAEKAATPDAQSVFEIGSVSKVFSTSLLSVLVGQGVLSLDDRIESHLPFLDLAPEIAEITLFDLATHTSGFDRLGKLFNRMYTQDVTQLYARYTKEDLYAEFEQAELVRPRRSGWEYSIPAIGMLGHIMELATGRTWSQLLAEHVTGPLGLSDTLYEIDDEQWARLVRGVDPAGEPSSSWYWNVLLSQGGLRSTLDDLLAFAEANVADDGSALTTDLRRARRTYLTWPEGFELAPGVTPPFQQALGWRTFDFGYGKVDEHGGATLSYQTQLGVCEESQSGFAAITCYDRAGFEDAAVFPVVALKAMRTALEVLST